VGNESACGIYRQIETRKSSRDPTNWTSVAIQIRILGLGPANIFVSGRAFAKLEMRVLFESLIERFPDLALGGAPSRLTSNSFNGFRHMPVTFSPQSPVN
jgi:hypothetical protein